PSSLAILSASFTGEKRGRAVGTWAAAGAIAGAAAGARGATVLGPAPLFRLRWRHRSQVVVKAHDRAAAIAAVRVAVDHAANAREHREVAFSVDVDPQ
ncbi:MAG: hypothetical protein ACAH82_18825, partial [Solirubrobacteraceae bacterium]